MPCAPVGQTVVSHHRTFVSLIERGQRNITLETIEKLAVALNVGMPDLMPRRS